MTTQFFAEKLFLDGFTDLVSVIPPTGQLSPNSKIPQTALGKVPGRRLPNGLWAGYNWRKHEPTIDDVRSWCLQGANIGLRADWFPGVDIDCQDEQLVRIITQAAIAKLGPAPTRVGRAPKQLLVYGTNEPFGRMRLWIGDKHLVEVLGQGQQYLVSGIHPGTQRPYEWTSPLTDVNGLVFITREDAAAFIAEVEQIVNMLGLTTEREGDGKPITRSAALDQNDLHAPSIDLVRQAVAAIPNSNDLFPDRTDYLRMGYAIRAAVGEDNLDEGLEIFEEWAGKWEGNARITKNEPQVVYEDWTRMRGEKSVGWPWLAEQARRFGFNDAELEFSVLRERPEDRQEEKPQYSDQGLADEVVRRLANDVRFVNQTDKFLVWDQGRWSPDAERLAESLVVRELGKIASPLLRQGATEPEKKKNYGLAMRLCSAGIASAVTGLVRIHRDAAVSLGALDFDPWKLNTPGGIVDLKTGALGPADREALCTKSTAVTPLFSGECPHWLRFLSEAAAGDEEVIGYLRRLCGYCLTGSTKEQQLTFIWGPGGNGKGVFLNVLYGVLGDYARQASMDTFTAASGDRHSTELAMFHGARVVTASETQAGKRWDEQRVKGITGGDPITARFMRQDFFTFVPQCKLVFVGNHKPEIRDVDKAMRRRIQLLPFVIDPAVVDKELGEKLRAEWPAILGWMVRGCLEWQEKGLLPPETVKVATDEYFDNEDAVGRWLRDHCEVGEEFTATSQELFASWQQWAHANGEKYVGSVKRVSSALVGKKFQRWEEPKTRRQGFAGLRPRNRQEFEIA